MQRIPGAGKAAVVKEAAYEKRDNGRIGAGTSGRRDRGAVYDPAGLFQVSGAVPVPGGVSFTISSRGAPIPVNSVCFTGMRTPPLRFFLFRRTAGSVIPIL